MSKNSSLLKFLTIILTFCFLFLVLPKAAYATTVTKEPTANCILTGSIPSASTAVYFYVDNTYIGAVTPGGADGYNRISGTTYYYRFSGPDSFYDGTSHTIKAVARSSFQEGSASFTSSSLGCDANSPAGVFSTAPNYCNSNWTGSAYDNDSNATQTYVDFWLIKDTNNSGKTSTDPTLLSENKFLGSTRADQNNSITSGINHGFSFNPRTGISQNQTTFFSGTSWVVTAFSLNYDINGIRRDGPLTDAGFPSGSLHRIIGSFPLTCFPVLQTPSCTPNYTNDTAPRLVTWTATANGEAGTGNIVHSWTGLGYGWSVVKSDCVVSPGNNCDISTGTKNEHTYGQTFSDPGTYTATVTTTSRDSATTTSVAYQCPSFTLSAPAGPTISSLSVTNAGTVAGGFSSASRASGNQSTQGGSNWYNPITITLNATGSISKYYVAFYDQTGGILVDCPDTTTCDSRLTTIQSRLATRNAGFLLAYGSGIKSGDSGNNYYVWDPSSNSWMKISAGATRQICSTGTTPCTSTTRLYTISTGTVADSSAPYTWRVLFDKNFGSKNMYTAGYVVDTNNLSTFESNKTPSQ